MKILILNCLFQLSNFTFGYWPSCSMRPFWQSAHHVCRFQQSRHYLCEWFLLTVQKTLKQNWNFLLSASLTRKRNKKHTFLLQQSCRYWSPSTGGVQSVLPFAHHSPCSTHLEQFFHFRYQAHWWPHQGAGSWAGELERVQLRHAAFDRLRVDSLVYHSPYRNCTQ